MSESYRKIRVEEHLDGALWRVLLNAPKGNVLDAVMTEDLAAVLDRAAGAGQLRLLVFEGAGPHFSFGASVEEHVRDRVAAMLRGFHALFLRMVDLSLPTAALVRGQCLGGGLELASFCHFLFAEPGARFGQPEIKLGVFPPPASLILPLKVGQARADLINLTGESLGADRAREIGLVTEIVPEGDAAWEFVLAWARERLLPLSAASLRRACAASRMHFNAVLRERLPELERFYLEDLMATHDASEGIAAFLEKRPPAWKHA